MGRGGLASKAKGSNNMHCTSSRAGQKTWVGVSAPGPGTKLEPITPRRGPAPQEPPSYSTRPWGEKQMTDRWGQGSEP